MKPVERVKMADVAHAAGVSVATVSKVLNRRDGIAPATVDRVLSAVDDLGYETSLGARSLRSARTGVLGVLVAEFEPFSTELLKGVSEAISQTDYELLAYSGGHRGSAVGWERRSLGRLGGSLIDGAILVTPTVVDLGATIPVVAIDPHTGPVEVPSVDSDNLGGARLATEHLLALGHRDIAMISGRPDLESARLREQGFREAMSAAGVTVVERWVRAGDYRSESTIGPAREILTGSPRPTAVFAANDLSAIATMQVADELGLAVPADLSVVGFDNVPESAHADPPLTTISQPLHQIGRTALDLLVSLLDGNPPTDTHVHLPTTMVQRASTQRL